MIKIKRFIKYFTRLTLSHTFQCCENMVVSLSKVITEIRHAASVNDQSALEKNVFEALHQSGRKERRNVINTINRVILDVAFEKNNPTLLFCLKSVSNENIAGLFSPMFQYYIKTQDQSWVQAILKLAQLQERKSNQSRILAIFTQMLIEAGIERSNPVLIVMGMETLDLISFRKYRSKILVDIIPSLITWGIKINNINFLENVYTFIAEIGDASKRSVLQAMCATAIGAVAVEKKDVTILNRSLHIATSIKQKNRRQNTIRSIISSAARTPLKKTLFNLTSFIVPFQDLPEDLQLEIIDAILGQLLDQEKDRGQLTAILFDISEKIPFAKKSIILNLLKKAQYSGEFFYLSTAIEFQNQFNQTYSASLKEIVKAGISVAEISGNITALTGIVPYIEKSCNIEEASRIFIQLTQIIASKDHFEDALMLFSRIGEEPEHYPSFDACCILIFKKGIVSDNIALVRKVLSQRMETKIYFNNICRVTLEICKNFQYLDIINHIDSINSLILLYPQRDQLLLDSISILINRGFLDEMDPGILIKLSDSISAQSLKEQALSKIVTKIAKIGVKNKNRDFLQRSVGLTCLIEEEKTRSATLTTIIDDATMLAVLEGDLDLLRRMRDWSVSLLSKDSEIYATANIINGMIIYAIDKRYPDALEEAYNITEDIHDPSLKKNLVERIFECFVQIGCLEILEHHDSNQSDQIFPALHSFERSLELLYLHWKNEERSLKIANLIDIVLKASSQKFSENFYIPLALFSLQIENADERDAMVSRIVTTINTKTSYSDSTDPYEIFVNHLMRIEFIQTDPALLDLVFRSVERVKDLFTRSLKLSGLAASFISLDKKDRSAEILQDIVSSLDSLPFIFQQVLLLSDITYLFSEISQDKAKECLLKAIHLLTIIEPDRESFARKQVVGAIAGMYERTQEKTLVNDAMQIISRIQDPIEYINAMIYLYRMVREDPIQRTAVMKEISKKCKVITSPGQKASIFLDIAMTINDPDDTFSSSMIRDAEILIGSIKISSVADIIRERIAKAYMVISNKKNYTTLVKKAARILHEIQNEETKKNCLDQMERRYTQHYEPLYNKIKNTAQKIIDDGEGAGNIATIEKLIHASHDRQRRVQYFCNISVLFKNRGKPKIATRLLDMATAEAKIIRPLSERAYVLCDIAMILFFAGCEKKAQNILDESFDAATKIRQFQERESVFDNLGFAIKFIRQA
jgi:hypothetical protein